MAKNFVENQNTYNLYVQKPLLRALLIVIIPGLIMAFMIAVYAFTDQIMLSTFIPKDIANQHVELFKGDGWNYDTIIAIHGRNPTWEIYDVGAVVKSALSISSPFSTIFTTVPFFIAGGAGVMFTQAIGRGDRQRAYEIFKTGLFIVIALALLSTLIILLIAKPLLTVLAGPAVKLNTPGHQTGDMEIMQAYYNQVHNTEIDFAYRYVFVLGSAMIMPMLIFYFSSLIKSEGRFKIVALFSVFCNLCNILADYVMVMFAHDGMRGGGIASVECYAINIILLAVYLFYLNSKNKTWLKFHALIPFSKKVRARGFFIRPIVLIGLAALMIDLSYSISMMFFIPILAHLSTIYPPPGAQGATYFQTISGAVMPIINLSFMTVYGIVEGERIVVSYNYAIGNWKRVRQTYKYTIFISLIFALLCMIFLGVIFGDDIIHHLFHINDPNMLKNAHLYLMIVMVMIPIYSFQVASMSMFLATNEVVLSNIAAILQNFITYFPVLGIMIAVTCWQHSIWFLVATIPINAFVSTVILTIYSLWWLRNRFEKIRIKTKVNGEKHIIQVAYTKPKMSIAQMALIHA